MMISAQLFDIDLPYPGKPARRVRVYVPAHDEGELLPVIYMTDGQNLFDEESSAWGCWHTRESVEAERQSSGRAAIIVGLHNDNRWRDNELTPAGIGTIIGPQEMDDFTEPEGEIFDGFLMDTVKTYVEANYPVRRGRESTAVCGSSSGGLQAFFTALSHPEAFSMAGVFSPAFLLYSEDDIRFLGAASGKEGGSSSGKAYISGKYVLVDSPNDLCFELLKNSSQREKIRESIRLITGPGNSILR